VKKKDLHHVSKYRQVILLFLWSNISPTPGKTLHHLVASHAAPKSIHEVTATFYFLKWTQCSKIHEKEIRFFSYMILCLFTSLTVLMLEVKQMDVFYIKFI